MGEEGSTPDGDGSRNHILTIGLEDYFQVGAFQRVIQRRQWYRFERTVERGTLRTLELLEEHDAQATFFVLGSVAEELPELIRGLVEAGHEVASKGFYHRDIGQMAPEEFRDDLSRASTAIESATGLRVAGYRVPGAWFGPSDLWALSVLAEEGYQYDSSIALIGRRFSDEPWRRFVHTHLVGEAEITEVPISSTRWFGLDVPIAGGNYFRQFPPWLMRSAVRRWDRDRSAPYVMYFHTWEMDDRQPRINAASRIQKTRHYRNLKKMPERISWLLNRYRFSSVSGHLGLKTASLDGVQRSLALEGGPERDLPLPPDVKEDRPERTPVTVVIPCYNEEVVIPYLKNTLDRMKTELGDRYRFTFILVDDASTDKTRSMLGSTFGEDPDCVLISREVNGGVARAIFTGLLEAETETVCSIDCDCSYDPQYLGSMIPLLDDDTDLVTASPYHPEGGVRNVPGWRLFLSKGLSRLYRAVLKEDLHTFTACFRVYRRSSVAEVRIDRGGFLGVAEMLGRLSLNGGRTREFPAVLEARIMGQSKMKVLRTILGHLRLLSKLAWLRVWKGKPARALAPGTGEEVPNEHNAEDSLSIKDV